MNVAQEEADTTNRTPMYTIGPKSKVTHCIFQDCGYTQYVVYCYVLGGASEASYNIINNCSGNAAMIKAITANDNCLHNNTDLAEYAGGDRDGTKGWWHDDTSGGDAGGLLGDSETGNLLGINPYFADASTSSAPGNNNRNYRLLFYSACRNAATGSSESFDREGKTRLSTAAGCAPDIGPIQYHLTGTDAYSSMTKDTQYDIDNDFTVNMYKNLAKQHQTRKSYEFCGVDPAPPPFSLGLRGPISLRGRVHAYSSSVG